MKDLSEKFERIMMAVSFAESGEHETAREILRGSKTRETDRPKIWKRAKKEYRAEAPKR